MHEQEHNNFQAGHMALMRFIGSIRVNELYGPVQLRFGVVRIMDFIILG